MTPEESLLNYLYPRLVEALQTWKGFDDIYGIWIGISLYEDDPMRPSIDGVSCLRHSATTPEKADSYGSAWAPPVSDDASYVSLGLCADSWPPEDQREEMDYVEFNPGDVEGHSLREAYFSWRRLSNPQKAQGGGAFLEVCGQVIKRLHTNNILVDVCGRPVPVGLFIGNDVGNEVTLPDTRDNNPDRLSKEMEEWMLGTTYEQLARDKNFLVEVRSWPEEKQAHFWCEALRGYKRYTLASVYKFEPIGAVSTPEWDWAKNKYKISTITLDWDGGAVSRLAHLLVEAAAPKLDTPHHARGDSPEQTIAESFIMELFALGSAPRQAAQVEESTITLLHEHLSRLYEKSKNEERIGVALQLTARALHALRPERFPVVKFGGRRENANRLLEPEKFGLE